MSILLFVVGAIAFAIGVAMIGFGIPINEFSFGNTLIISGTMAAVGGLIVLALGIAVSQLQRLTDALATRAPIRSSRPFDTFEPAAPGRPQAAAARVPFPPKTKPDTRTDAQAASQAAAFSPREPMAPEPRSELPVADYAAPTLPNPDEPPVTAADEAFLSPLQPVETSGRRSPPFFGAPELDADRRGSEADADRRFPEADTGRGSDLGTDRRSPEIETDRDEHDASPPPPRPKPNTYFDAMWPAEPKLPDIKSTEPKPVEPKPADLKRAGDMPAAEDMYEAGRETDAFGGPPEDGPRAVAILKSGVVDGMGYTLYVDGSIEAELPQGTLRFASINELRSHLEKTS
jgi:hypothetical protein